MPMMMYFRMQLLSHGTGPSAWLIPLADPGVQRRLPLGSRVPVDAPHVLVWFDRATVEGAGRIGGCGGALRQAELAEQHRHVVLHCLLGNEQPLADLPVGEAFPDQLQDAALVC